MENEPNKAYRFFKILTWWRIDKEELANQIANYDTLSVWKAARKVSGIFLIFSALATFFMTFFDSNLSMEGNFVYALLLGFLAFFDYRGHRWALLSSMLLWTFEKGYSVAFLKANPGGQIIWWAIYMSQFFLAFKIERERAKTGLKSNSSFKETA